MNEKIPFCILFSLVVCSQHANNNHDHKLNSKYIWTRTARAKSQSTERIYMCVSLTVCAMWLWVCIQSGYAKSLQLNWFFTITIILSFEFQLLLLFHIYIQCMIHGVCKTRPMTAVAANFYFIRSVFHRYIFVGCVERRRKIVEFRLRTKRREENLKYIRSIDQSIKYSLSSSSLLLLRIWFKYFGSGHNALLFDLIGS